MRLLFFLLVVSIFTKVAVQAVCVDNPDGYDDYNCQDYAHYCTRSGLWYDEFRSACRKTCIICQEKRFKLTKHGKDCSDEGEESLSSIGECKEAAKELEQKFVSELSMVNFPKGCASLSSQVYWNKHKTGDRERDTQAICRKSGCRDRWENCDYSISLYKNLTGVECGDSNIQEFCEKSCNLCEIELPDGVVSCGDGWFSKITKGHVDALAICAGEGYLGPITEYGINHGIQCKQADDKSGNLNDFGETVSWKCTHVYIKSHGACEDGTSKENSTGMTFFSDRECKVRCLESIECTGYSIPIDKYSHWCTTYTSPGLIGDQSSSSTCYMKKMVLNWPKMASAYCPGGYGRFTTIHQAITACLEDQNCAAISDQGCNNRGFSLCRQNHQPKESIYGSCIYLNAGCTDYYSDCANEAHLCNTNSTMREFCQKTCGICENPSTSVIPVPAADPICDDLQGFSDCARWKIQGDCTNEMRSWMKYNCFKTCGHCSSYILTELGQTCQELRLTEIGTKDECNSLVSVIQSYYPNVSDIVTLLSKDHESSYPEGCIINTRGGFPFPDSDFGIYFNNGTWGYRNGYSRSVCKTSLTQKFVMSDEESDCDDLGAQYVLTGETCKEATRALRLSPPSILSISEDDSYPKGCHVGSYEIVYFNNATNGKRRTSHRNICKLY